MYFKNIVKYNDKILTDIFLQHKIYDNINVEDLNTILYHCNDIMLLTKASEYWNMNSATKLVLYNKTGIMRFTNNDIKYLCRNISELELLEILKKHSVTSYYDLLEYCVDNRWDNVIKYISQFNIRHHVTDVNIMNKLKYAMNISPNIHISLTTIETMGNTYNPKPNLYNIHEYNIIDYKDKFINIPIGHNVKIYKRLISNINIIKDRGIKPICTNGLLIKYLHHQLFRLIFGNRVHPSSGGKISINIPIMDYLAHEYPESISKLWLNYHNNHTIRRLCAKYYSSYLDRDKIEYYSKKFTRLHINCILRFSDVVLRTIY